MSHVLIILMHILLEAHNYGLHCSIECRGMIHISNISNARIDKISNVFEIGEQIKMIVVNCPIPDKFSFRHVHSYISHFV